jgi:NADH-quinone oxidoreductase subunit C
MFEVRPNIVAQLTQKLLVSFGNEVDSGKMLLDIPTFTINKKVLLPVIQMLYNDENLQFRFLTTLCGVHYPDKELQFGVVYHLHSFKHNLRIRIKSFTSVNDLVFPTMTPIFSAANWLERETYDFYGIKFEGHPHLKRILNVDDMEDFPMRKEFPLEDQTRQDKNDSMFGR